MASTIFLVRHGEAASNVGRFFDGWGDSTDSPLTELGREQAKILHRRLAKEEIGGAFCSDALRTRETMQLLSLTCPVTHTPDLRERNYGELEGVCWGDEEEHFERHHVDPYYCAKGGETCGQVQRRVWDYFESNIFPSPHEKVLVVSHHGPIVLLACRLLGMPLSKWRALKFGNCGLSILTCEAGMWRIKLWNSLSHYGLMNFTPLLTRELPLVKP